MATTCYPTTTATDYAGSGLQTNHVKRVLTINGSRGAGVTTITDNTGVATTIPTLSTIFVVGNNAVNGTNLTNASSSNFVYNFWITPALSAVTVSGAITVNFRGLESNAMANFGPVAGIYKLTSTTATLIGSGSNNNEFGTVEGAQSISITPTSTSIAAGDRLMVAYAYAGANGTTSAGGFTASFFYAGTSGGASGDSFVTFTETLTAQAAGTTYTKAGFGRENA